ncbi:hypothetical protein DMH04_14500 [Kibdelosporangium aridum]|uniref:Uncharacterized protein n=1 Tax=Kibdelosporangium aridum TaxID=2030 RepID=A0A428ZE93_KIBAR|nr:hypothetical protein [Kibdelosporangium aridum]RSM86365.1 hypothetical protein DMH04_14500 [Kibdelosporangium aridum]
MTEAQEDEKARPRVVRGTPLPKSNLQQAQEVATKLWELGRTQEIPRESLAQSLGMSEKSSAYDMRIGSMGHYGLATASGGTIKITELGRQVVQDFDSAAQLDARRQALLSQKHFAAVLAEYDGDKLANEEILAKRFHYQHSVNLPVAQQAARALIESARYAQVLDAENNVSLTKQEQTRVEEETTTGHLDEPEAPTAPTIEAPHAKMDGLTGAKNVTSGDVTVNVTVNITVNDDNVEGLRSLLKTLGLGNKSDNT